MNEKNQSPQSQSPLPDDSLAAALGFITTISQIHMGMGQEDQNQSQESSQPQDKQESGSTQAPEASKQPQETSSVGNEDVKRDEAMQKEIDDIRAELEQLKQEDTQENDTGTTTENTEPAS